jgi:hypothetical protein
MKTNKEEEDSDDAKFCSLKGPINHEDKEFKTYTVKVKKYDSGTPEEFLKWRLTLNEKVKNNGYDLNYDNIMNLAQAMLAGRHDDFRGNTVVVHTTARMIESTHFARSNIQYGLYYSM